MEKCANDLGGVIKGGENAGGLAGAGAKGSGDAVDGLQHIYKSIKDAPNYPADFLARQNGTVKNKVNNNELLEELRKIEGGDRQKVYTDGFDEYGNEISIHYFQSKTGQVFDVKVVEGWSNPQEESEYR